MEIKHIKELMAVMGRTGTHRLQYKKDGFELVLEREENAKLLDPMIEAGDDLIVRKENALQRASFALPKTKESSAAHNLEAHDESSNLYVTSPMVGTFYSTPSPEDPAFVKVGDKIEKHTVVCIIEAMKVMNEVKAGVAGTVVEILVENNHPVEFGTKLFRVT